MSKIRNLLGKFKKNKKNSQDLDEIFYEQESAEHEHFDSEDEDIPDLDLPSSDLSEEEFEYDDTALTNIEEHSQQLDHQEDEEFDYEDIEELIALENKEQTEKDSFDYTFNENTFTGEIDLDNDKVTFKDKIDHLGTRIVDRFRIMGKKDLNQAMKPPKDNTETGTKIKVSKLKEKVNKVKWDKFIDRILSTNKNQTTHHYFQISIAIFCTYLLANIVGGFISGDTNYKNAGKGSPIVFQADQLLQSSDINQIKTANVFKTSQEVAQIKDPVVTQPKVHVKCEKADSKSTLPIKLHHSIVLQDSIKSIASVSVRSNKVQHIREGDKISSMAKVDKIDRLELIIRNMKNGNCESIQNSKLKKKLSRNPPNIRVMPPEEEKDFIAQQNDVKGIKTDGTNFTIDRQLLNDKLQDISKLITEARAIQINNPDGTLSFKIVEIAPDSVFASLGVQNGDIIRTIGGEPIQSLNEIMGLFGKLKNLNSLKLGLSRKGETIDQSYTIK